MSREHSPYYPVFLNVAGKRCVVVGGGEVALRKVKGLLGHRARVVVISPDLFDGLAELEKSAEITVFRREYRSGDLEGAFLVIAATDDRTANRLIAEECGERNIMVNVVDDPALSSFISPAVVERGDLTIAISTAGGSPALARKIRERLEGAFGPEYTQLVEVVEELRQEMQQRGLKVGAERWQAALDIEPVLEAIRGGRPEDGRRLLIANLGLCGVVEQ